MLFVQKNLLPVSLSVYTVCVTIDKYKVLIKAFAQMEKVINCAQSLLGLCQFD